MIDKGVCPQPFEFRIMRPDNTIRYVYRECELVRDEAGRPILVAGMIHDITDLRAAQERQKELERQLRHSQKLKALGTLAGGIAHDLNNTLVPILALSKHVAERMPSGSVDREDLETIVFGSERARDLVRQVLLLSRKQALAKEDVDLASVVQKSLQMIRVTVPERVRIVEYIGDVPPLQGDAGQLQQVVVNLVTNAIQAIGSGSGTVTVTVAPAAADDWSPAGEPRAGAVALTVVDTGCGMDAVTLDRIFEPFYTTKQVGQGTGLGLSVVHGIVSDHGGRIEVDSELHKGTRIRVVLPTMEVTGGSVRPVVSAAEPQTARSVLNA
jgi:signal transduction histidine kinase